MTARQLHPCRCETCTNCDKSQKTWYCNVSDESLDSSYIDYYINKLGCLSHPKARERWHNRLNGILKTAKFFDQVDTMLQEVVREMEEESKAEKD